MLRIAPFLAAWALAFGLFAPAAARAEAPPEVRILVSEGPDVIIDGQGSPLRLLSQDNEARRWRPGASAAISAGERGLESRGLPLGSRLELQNGARRYRIGERIYRGALSVVWRTRGKLQVIDRLPLEEYLVGLLGSEISPSWPAEAQKAQAVAARTYALHHAEAARHGGRGLAYDMTSTMLFQVYDGVHKEDGRLREAVAGTRGQVLLRAGALFPSYYHSCCGGRTEHAHNVWAGEEGPPPIEDAFCVRSPKMFWSWQVPVPQFVETLRANGVAIDHVEDIATEIEEDDPRVGRVLLSDRGGIVPIKATELRRIFGYGNVKSTWFDVAIKGSELVFTGRGYGHGVGMCQWGARGMAEAGKGYREILKFYYPDAEVSTAY